jgi:hypothetical protein
LDNFGRALEWIMSVYFMVIRHTYISAIWYILRQFGNLAVIWIFPPFWYILSRKIWQTWLKRRQNCQKNTTQKSLFPHTWVAKCKNKPFDGTFTQKAISSSHLKMDFSTVRYIHAPIRVARWFIFKPNSQVWVNIGWSWNGKCLVWLSYQKDCKRLNICNICIVFIFTNLWKFYSFVRKAYKYVSFSRKLSLVG